MMMCNRHRVAVAMLDGVCVRCLERRVESAVLALRSEAEALREIKQGNKDGWAIEAVAFELVGVAKRLEDSLG